MPTSNECLEYLQRGDLERGIDCLNQVIGINPKNAVAFVNRGAAKGSLRRYESAISDYDRAIELDPNNVWAFYGRGLVKMAFRKSGSNSDGKTI